MRDPRGDHLRGTVSRMQVSDKRLVLKKRFARSLNRSVVVSSGGQQAKTLASEMEKSPVKMNDQAANFQ